MTPAPIIYLVDDDPSFLPAISRLLGAAGYTVRAFSSPAEFLKALPAAGPGCAVLDLQMPGLSGLDLQEAIAKQDNPLPIVFLTGQGDVPAAVRAMRQGAEDFLSKLASERELLAAIQRALERNTRERAQRERQREVRLRFDTLTAREREVMTHVVRGQMNKQTAAELAISERTVKLHRTAITNKLRVHSVAELVQLVQEAGLLKDGQLLR
jgi:FixJ family two-component response regulator